MFLKTWKLVTLIDFGRAINFKIVGRWFYNWQRRTFSPTPPTSDLSFKNTFPESKYIDINLSVNIVDSVNRNKQV